MIDHRGTQFGGLFYNTWITTDKGITGKYVGRIGDDHVLNVPGTLGDTVVSQRQIVKVEHRDG